MEELCLKILLPCQFPRHTVPERQVPKNDTGAVPQYPVHRNLETHFCGETG